MKTRLILTILALLSPVVTATALNAAEMLSIPVPKQTIRKGEVITVAMLTEREFPSRRVGRNMVDHPDALVGLMATRNLRAQSPIQAQAVRVPPDVSKNSRVTLQHSVGSLSITATVRAVEEGMIGETIRFQNLNSNEIVYGEVTGPGLAKVVN